MARARATKAGGLPTEIQELFWDFDARQLSWETDRELILGRTLASGTWAAIQWLRHQAGDDAIKAWILARQGAGLSPQQLRFWELILELPRRTVNAWLRGPGRQVWDRRAKP